MNDASKTPTMRPKTYTYQNQLEWGGARGGTLAAHGKPDLRVASPPEFKGEAGVWTPEDLFVGALNICTMTTFVSHAERAGLKLRSYRSSAEGLLELVEGSFRFTRVVVRPEIAVEGPATAADVERHLHESHKRCLVSNSVRCAVILEPTVRTA